MSGSSGAVSFFVSIAQNRELVYLLDNKLLRVREENRISVIEYLILDSSLIRSGIWEIALAPT